MKRTFIELPAFTRLIRSGVISDTVLREIQSEIMRAGGDVIPGTAGLVKIRAAVGGRGKSGGVRAIYAEYPGRNVVVPIVAYRKNMKTTLSPEEKQALAQMKRRLDKQIRGA